MNAESEKPLLYVSRKPANDLVLRQAIPEEALPTCLRVVNRFRLRMKILPKMPRPKGFCFPRKIIAYAVCVHHRFLLSAADVEDLLAERSGRSVGKRSGSGSTALAVSSRIASDETGQPQPTNGIWTKWSLRSTVGNAGFGEPWTRTEILLILSSNLGGVLRLPDAFRSG